MAHQSAQELVQKLQSKVDKIRRLTETCQQQEKIIEKMERIISNPKKNTKKGKLWWLKSTHYNNGMAWNAFGSTSPVPNERVVEQTFELFKMPWDSYNVTVKYKIGANFVTWCYFTSYVFCRLTIWQCVTLQWKCMHLIGRLLMLLVWTWIYRIAFDAEQDFLPYQWRVSMDWCKKDVIIVR